MRRQRSAQWAIRQRTFAEDQIRFLANVDRPEDHLNRQGMLAATLLGGLLPFQGV